MRRGVDPLRPHAAARRPTGCATRSPRTAPSRRREQLLALTELPGLPAVKIPRLHGIAEAALEGRLDRERLLAHEDPVTELQTLPGIGPFYANLIYVRAVGPTDAPPPAEPRLHKAVQERYGRPVEDVADGWRPFRTWVSVLIRASA